MISSLTTTNSSRIFIFIIIFLLFSISSTILLLKSPYQKLKLTQFKNLCLNQQQHERKITLLHSQQLKQDTLILEYPYLTRLQALRKSSGGAELYTQIGLLAKAHHLQMLMLKPQKSIRSAGLKQQVLNIDISGSELKILNFVQLLMHQSWLLKIQQLELIPMEANVHLQATLVVYYADN